jgi:cell wall-associated NlpC family hydrolase
MHNRDLVLALSDDIVVRQRLGNHAPSPAMQSMPRSDVTPQFRCSGPAMMAYGAAGLVIPRTSHEQWAAGPRVPPGQQQPGDLVFFAGPDGTARAPGHVGIVIGDGEMIEAYATGFPIRVSGYGRASSPPGDQTVVGFTRPVAGSHL